MRRSSGILCALVVLSACGGGGGPKSPDVRVTGLPGTETPTHIRSIRALTQAQAPTETAATQDQRLPDVAASADRFDLTSIHYNVTSPVTLSFALEANCSYTSCTYTHRETGLSDTISIAEARERSWFTLGNVEILGTRHGVTSIRASGRYTDPQLGAADTKAFGSWMNHSGFIIIHMEGEVQAPVQGRRIPVEFRARMGYAAGDLSGARPSASATWRGIMTGTPATGSRSNHQLQGDVELVYRPARMQMDATFSNIVDIKRLAAHSVEHVRFTNIPVSADGRFASGTGQSSIKGGLYGPSQHEAAGVFEASNILVSRPC